jgi:molybdopterin-containing oxidoreductase family membrane subunit
MSEALPGRAPRRLYAPWMLLWAAVFAVGLYAGLECLLHGLNRTGMDNRFGFGLWIFLDLTVIALGAGAFFTGFLFYVLKRHTLDDVIKSAVIVGFVCYSGAVAVLVVDVGQPLRSWFSFWHPNTHSMLTEVVFCITCYLLVLAIEYVPVILKQRRLSRIPSFLVFEFELHKLMPVFAIVGTFLSFFHQGSLGGVYGVLQGQPFAFREGFLIWPTTFFLFVLSAIATGPAFLLLVNRLVEALAQKRLVRPETYELMARISGWLLLAYVLFKGIDTLYWLNVTAPALGFSGHVFYGHPPFGTWVLLAEIVLFGAVPAFLLTSRRARRRPALVNAAAILACLGVTTNRLVMTLQTQALPKLSFASFASYLPTWQEVAVGAGMIAYGVLVFSLSYRYLPLYPRERELGGNRGGA